MKNELKDLGELNTQLHGELFSDGNDDMKLDLLSMLVQLTSRLDKLEKNNLGDDETFKRTLVEQQGGLAGRKFTKGEMQVIETAKALANADLRPVDRRVRKLEDRSEKQHRLIVELDLELKRLRAKRS
jgi:hypothetical protein